MSVSVASVVSFSLSLVAIVLAQDQEPIDTAIWGSESYRDDICGREKLELDSRVAHGYESQQGDWPWHGALFYNMDYQCGGSLISEWFMVTAAHCMYNPETMYRFNIRVMQVYLGLYDLNDYSSHGREFSLEEAIVCPKFEPDSHAHDIALLLLGQKVEFDQFIQPIMINFKENPWMEIIAGNLGTVVGWGVTEKDELARKLMVAQMPIVRYTECLQSNPSLFSNVIHEGMYCAGNNNGTSVCNGDSGGGMYLFQDGHWYLRGIVSFSGVREGSSLCDLNSFAGFVNVAFYGHWIQKELHKHANKIESLTTITEAEDNHIKGRALNDIVSTEIPKLESTTQSSTPSTTTVKPPSENSLALALQVQVKPPQCLQHHSKIVTVRQNSSVSLLCHLPTKHASEVNSMRWFRENEYFIREEDLSANVLSGNRSIHDILILRNVEARDSGRYFCRAQFADRNITDNRTVAVTGTIPEFGRDAATVSYLRYQTVLARDTFKLQLSFKADSKNGFIFHHSCGEQLATLSLVENRLEFHFRTSRKTISKLTSTDHSIQLGKWHTVLLSSYRGRGFFTLDDRLIALFQERMLSSNCDQEDIYLGSIPNHNGTPFTGCISSMVLNDHHIDLWKEPTASRGITRCQPCARNPCSKQSVCIETGGRTGFKCLCQAGYVGKNCTRGGESCTHRTCLRGFCRDWESGFRCFCPPMSSGPRCERENKLDNRSISFNSYGFAQYKLHVKRNDFLLKFNFTPRKVKRSIVAYLLEENHGTGNFMALVIVDNRLELRYAADLEVRVLVLKSTVLLESNVSYTVKCGYNNEFVFLQVNDEPERSNSIFGDLFCSDRDHFLYLGGWDEHSSHRMHRCLDIEHGFDGCVEELTVSDEAVNITTDFIDARNVASCD